MVERFNSGAAGAPAAIVFVHGFTGAFRKTWQQIPDILMAEPGLASWDLWGFGYESHKFFDLRRLWSSDASLEQIATMLYTEPALAKYKRLALVAHSMGGLVVQRALVKYKDLREKTSHVFLFGTPSAGLEKANLASFFKQQIEDMAPRGPFITQLRPAWDALGPLAFKFWTTAGETDQFVPPDSSLQPFPESTHRVIPGNHITMLTSAQSAELLVQGLTAGAAKKGPRDAARVAVERGEFQKIVDDFGPHRDDLDDQAAVQLAIALESLGRREEAIEFLARRPVLGTDVQGTFAGRLKRRWLIERRQSDYDMALRLYREAYARAVYAKDPDQAHYLGINVAFLLLAARQDAEARGIAQEALGYAEAATRPTDKLWALASAGDALVITGHADEGISKHEQAGACKLAPWQALSIQEQALRVGALCGLSEEQMNRLSQIYGESV